MAFINQLVYNLLINITPIMLYHLLRNDKETISGKLSSPYGIAILCTITAILCMLCPFSFTPGYMYDLRFVPLFISFLFGGIRSGLLVTAVLVAYRLLLGGAGAYAWVISLGINVMLYIVFSRGLRRLEPSRRILYSGVVCFVGSLFVPLQATIRTIWTGAAFDTYFVPYFCLFSILHMAAASTAVWVIEQIRKNVKQHESQLQAEKINVLSELAASFAHEILNPLTVTSGFLQMMKQTGIPDEKKQLFNRLALEEVDKAQSIVKDYLSFAKPQFETQETFDAKTLLEEAGAQLRSYAQLHHVAIEMFLEEKLTVFASREKLAQSISHIVKNGIEAMPQGGKLIIVGTLQNQRVCIDVIDHGVGMTQEEIGRLGTPHYSTTQKGTGLGMMMAYRIIHLMRGKIEVISEVGKGTCFSISIPASGSASFH
ncbi:sensor histidine kinase [Paenibacillus thalictri]|nr:sensor histidine kinase [Paenibacillus thalictri]